jgi:hypothetical protein
MRIIEYGTYLVFFIILTDFFSYYKQDYRVICGGIVAAALVVTLLFALGEAFDVRGIGSWKLSILHLNAFHINDNIRRIGYLLEAGIIALLCWSPLKKKPLLVFLLLATPPYLFLLWL